MIITGIILNSYLNGLQGFMFSFYGIGLAPLLMLFLPGFKHSGGDIKLGMGYGAYLGHQSVLTIIFITLLILLIIHIYSLLKNNGFKGLWISLKLEMLSLGKIKVESKKMPGALIILIAYCITLAIV